MVRVFVADPDPIALGVIQHIIESDRQLELVGSTDQLVDLTRHATVADVGLVVVSEWFPGLVSPIDVVANLRQSGFVGVVVILALPTCEHELVRGLKAGVDAFILRSSDMSGLPRVLRRIVAEGTEVSSELMTPLLEEVKSEPTYDGLTWREREVLGLISEGSSNAKIATALGISVATVKTHVHHLIGKLGATSRLQLAIHGRELLDASKTRQPQDLDSSGSEGVDASHE